MSISCQSIYRVKKGDLVLKMLIIQATVDDILQKNIIDFSELYKLLLYLKSAG